MRKKSKRYKEIYKNDVKNKKIDIKEATKIICGSARSMGIEVKE